MTRSPQTRSCTGGRGRHAVGLVVASALALTVTVPLGAGAAGAATPSLSQDDETNTITGLTADHMWAADYQGPKGHNVWHRGSPGQTFPGAQRVAVAPLNEDAITIPVWNADTAYPKGSVVQWGGRVFTAKWWVEGAPPGAMTGPREFAWAFGEELVGDLVADFEFTPWGGMKAANHQRQERDTERSSTRVVGYFPEWGVYDAHDNYGVDDVPFEEITHLNYGFAALKESTPGAGDWSLQTFDEGAALGEDGLYRQVAEATARHGVRNVLSVGGWNNSVDAQWQDATRTVEQREQLSRGIVDFMLEHDFTALDVDWEYPSSSADADQFEDLIVRLRALLTERGLQNDAYYPLSVAVTPNHTKMEFIKPKVIVDLVDSINVMSYDFHGAFDPVTGHNSPLYAGSLVEDQKLDVESAMDELHTRWGVPKHRLLAGIGFYGRGWGDVEPTELIPGLPGLGAPGTATVKGQWDDEGEATGTNPWYTLRDLESDPAFTKYWDDEAKVPYLYSSTTQEFFTYDDPTSIQHKVDFIRENEYGGAIIWELSGDSDEHELSSIVGSLLDDAVPSLDVTKDRSSFVVSLSMSAAEYADADRYVVRFGGDYLFEIHQGTAPSATVTEEPSGRVTISRRLAITGTNEVTLVRATGKPGDRHDDGVEVTFREVEFQPTVTAVEKAAVKGLDWSDGTLTVALATNQFTQAKRFLVTVNDELVAETYQGRAYGASATSDGATTQIAVSRAPADGDVVEVRLADLGPGASTAFYQTLATHTVSIAPGPLTPVASTSTVRGTPGFVVGDGLQSLPLTVTLNDATGAPVTGLGGASFPAVVKVTGATAQVGAFTEGAPGVYTADVVSKRAGTAKLYVQLNDTTIGTSVAAQFVQDPHTKPDAGRSTARVTGGPQKADGASPITYVVTLKNAAGDPITGMGSTPPVTLKVSGTGTLGIMGVKVSSFVETSVEGTYEARITSTTPGAFTVSSAVDSVPLPTGSATLTFVK
ncbi:glycosyl hydrolase family 18 protein [Cellulomonas sp. NPDC058312]|uniref:glycosyl hydrolase family 18 protein n=1 Tax=Cellulomonas sp. NPDC058312 TaxID=3346441 RepID=UPI0036E43A60